MSQDPTKIERTKKLVDAYYEAWIGTKTPNTPVLEQTLATSMTYNGPIDQLSGRDAFLVGLTEFAQINGGVSFVSRLDGEDESFAIYDAMVVPLGESIRIIERFEIEDDKISKIDLVFDSTKLRPMIEAARSGATESSRVVVRYRVKADKIEENREAIRAVFAELHEQGPGGLRYMSLGGTDGTFVHIASVQGENPLANSDAFRAFQAGLKERCEEPPKALEVKLVGSYPT